MAYYEGRIDECRRLASGTPDPLERACYVAMEREFIERLRQSRQMADDLLGAPESGNARQRVTGPAPAAKKPAKPGDMRAANDAA